MGIFRKPIRALDRLPSRFRPASPEPATGRPDAFHRPPDPSLAPRIRGPGNAVTILIILLSGALLAAIVFLWQAGSAGPQAADGAPAVSGGGAGPAPAAETIATLLSAARSYADQQDFAKAEAILRAAVREHADDQELRIAFGETLMRQKKLGEAYEQYSKALDIGPREPKIDFVAGTLASQIGRLDESVDHYRSAQAGDPGNAQYPLYLAQVQIRQEKFDEAKVSLLLSAKLDAQNAVTWGSLAEIFLRENKLDLAIQNITRARTLQPELTRWKLDEARARSRQGDPQKALVLLLTLDRSERRDPEVLSLMAQSYGLLHRPADAAKTYEEASDAATTNAELAYQAALWADKAGGRDAALKYAHRAALQGHEGAKGLEAKLRAK